MLFSPLKESLFHSLSPTFFSLIDGLDCDGCLFGWLLFFGCWTWGFCWRGRAWCCRRPCCWGCWKGAAPPSCKSRMAINILFVIYTFCLSVYNCFKFSLELKTCILFYFQFSKFYSRFLLLQYQVLYNKAIKKALILLLS